MEYISTLSAPLPQDQNYQENSFQVLKEQSTNIQPKRLVIDKQQNNSSSLCNNMSQNPCLQPQRQTTPTLQLHQPLLSLDVSLIDERDDLLLSTTTVQDHLLSEDPQSLCDLHDKPEDILCLVQKKKICSYCALFGLHKDHIFKSEQQLSSQIDKKTKQLQQLAARFIKMKNSVIQKFDLKLMKQSCDYKLKEVLADIEHEYNEIIDKLKEAKIEIESKVMQETNQLIKDIEEEWQQVEIEITGCRLFEEWERCGAEVLRSFKEALKSSNVGDSCALYEQFPWGKGQNLIKANTCKLEEFCQHWHKQIQKFALLGNYSLTKVLATCFNLDHQSLTSLNVDNPVSIQELHNINTNQTIKLNPKPLKKPEASFKEEKQKFRHSEILESTLKPIRQSLQFDSRQSRNSAYGLMNKRKSQDISKNIWNSSTMLARFNSNHRNDQTFLSPKVKTGVCRSPRQTTNKQNPQRIVAQFQKNVAQNFLNLSNCGLEDDSLLYLIQKALSSHIPYEINLHKNTISNNGLIKLMPYLTKVQAVNLASTGLNDSCLQIFGKIKGSSRLEEVNLLQNGISLHKNKSKIEILRKSGLRIICQ